jgi:hypothetical protein
MRSPPTFASFHNPTKKKGFAERARASILLQQSSSFGFIFSYNMFGWFLLQNFVATINLSTSSFFLSQLIFLQNQAKNIYSCNNN